MYNNFQNTIIYYLSISALDRTDAQRNVHTHKQLGGTGLMVPKLAKRIS